MAGDVIGNRSQQQGGSHLGKPVVQRDSVIVWPDGRFLLGEDVAGVEANVHFHNRDAGLAVIPQTSTVASHVPRAVGVAFAIDRAAKLVERGRAESRDRDTLALFEPGAAVRRRTTPGGAGPVPAVAQRAQLTGALDAAGARIDAMATHLLGP